MAALTRAVVPDRGSPDFPPLFCSVFVDPAIRAYAGICNWRACGAYARICNSLQIRRFNRKTYYDFLCVVARARAARAILADCIGGWGWWEEPIRLKLTADGDGYADLLVERPGVYTYTLSAPGDDHTVRTIPTVQHHHHAAVHDVGAGAEDGDRDAPAKATRLLLQGHLLVSPTLRVRGFPLPLDGINLLTVVPKWMGPIDKWFDQLAISARTGYNLIHFVPMQERGISNSPYSIRDQLAMAPDNYAPNTAVPEREAQLTAFVERIEQELGMASLADVVWNHTAIDSPWLLEHPEAGPCTHPF